MLRFSSSCKPGTVKCSECFAHPRWSLFTYGAWTVCQPLHAALRAYFCEHPTVAKVAVAVRLRHTVKKLPSLWQVPISIHTCFSLERVNHICKNIFPPPIKSIASSCYFQPFNPLCHLSLPPFQFHSVNSSNVFLPHTLWYVSFLLKKNS